MSNQVKLPRWLAIAVVLETALFMCLVGWTLHHFVWGV